MRIQEATACTMSEHEHQILTSSFASVKFEFSDLDGLTWSPALKRHKLYPGILFSPSPNSIHLRTRTQSDSHGPFGVLSITNLGSHRPGEQLRSSASLPTALSSAFHSHVNMTSESEDEDSTPMSTPTQTDFSFDLSTSNSSRSLHIPASSPASTNVDKLILVDSQSATPVPMLKEKKNLRLRLPPKRQAENEKLGPTSKRCP